MAIKWLYSHDMPLDDFFIMPFKNGFDLAVDMYEDNGKLIVEMNLPGIYAKNVDISVENHHLRVTGSREEEKEKKDKTFYKKEIRRGSFERIIDLPSLVDDSKAVAEFKDGILRITLPKKRESEARKIKVS